jgi:hypothetical protein
MHVSRLALHVLLVAGEQGSATEGPDYKVATERGGEMTPAIATERI